MRNATDQFIEDVSWLWSPPKESIFFVPDGVGVRTAVPGPAALITTDTVGGDTATTATLTVDAAHTVSTIDTIGDQDFYAVTLVAGVKYEFGMYGLVGGPSGVALSDSYLELYDAQGNLVVSADGGASTPLNEANSGFDALLSYTATTSGTYYVNARAFDNAPADGTNGDLVGDYEVFAQVAPPGGYEPYYTPDEILYAIDWGSQVNKVNGTVRNPDGDEGTRPTGNDQGTPLVDPTTVAAAAAQGVDITGKNVISIYFARAGDVFTSLEDPSSPGLPPATVTAVGVQAFERAAVLTALGEFASVADVVYVEVDNRDDADFVYTSYQGTPGPGVSLLGSMSPPDEANEGLAQFNSGDERWNATNLQQGGFSFVTLIHEFGHGHGLAHPHDNGGRSGVMNGVEAEGAGVADYTTGDFALNQGVFTMMSYEDGWQSSPYGNAETDVGYGYLGGLMAFDIAAIQDKYGVNENYHAGSDTYTLKDVNAAGTFYSCIWDTGGEDRILYTGARDAVIDLRAATLRYEAGGGGWMSYASGIYGGFTIANAVVIENATSGSGNDTLRGNDVANVLDSGAGNDALFGGAGDDTLIGGIGDDSLDGGAGIDTASYAEAAAAVTVSLAALTAQNTGGGGQDTLTSIENLVGSRFADMLTGGTGANTLAGGNGADRLFGLAGTDLLNGGAGNDYLSGGADTDELFGGQGDDVLHGDNGNDQILGGDGDDVMFGDAGEDRLVGGNGNDVYFVNSAGDRAVELAGQGSDEIRAANVDWVLGDNFETLRLLGGNTNGTGNAIDNLLVGSEGANTLAGLGGNDNVRGNGGDDVLYGGGGNDMLYGGSGKDAVSGGAGADRFIFASLGDSSVGGFNADRIMDFNHGENDRIVLAQIDAVPGGDDNAFAFIGTAAFTHTAGEVRYGFDANGNTLVQLDVDGDGLQDMTIRIDGQVNLVVGDFVL